jgi:triosephosphate isomerase
VGISAEDALKTIMADEPLWAIGPGITPSMDEANETIGVLRNVLRTLYGDSVAQEIRIQYGGSMNAKNAEQIMAMPEIDGGLIGGASLVAEDFARIVNYTEQEYIQI